MCCAGIGRDGLWRRQYPVPFRILNDAQKFKRWDWIEYQYVKSENDLRFESQKVVPETLCVSGSIKPKERAKFLNPLVRETFNDADKRNESLTIIRPAVIEILHEEKSHRELESERQKHAELANQMSLFDSTAKPLEPCPMQFSVRWVDQDGKSRKHECDDWETSTAYIRFQREYDQNKAIEFIKHKYEEEYFRAGLVLAFSTHQRRNVTHGTKNQWLLVGLVRLDEESQGDLLLGN